MKMVYVTAFCRALTWSISCLLLGACSATGYSIAELAPSINATHYSGPTIVQVGDTVKLTFLGRTDLNQEVRVHADGTASFLGIDSVPVTGKTLPELDKFLTSEYAALASDPGEKPLSVDLLAGPGTDMSVAHETVFVVGEVTRPGPLPLVGHTYTLCEAISAAGGHLKRSANLCNTVLVRRLATGEMRSWRLNADIYRWGQDPAIFLQSRDIVFIPNTAIDEVNIWVDQWIRQMLPFPYLTAP